MFFPNELILEVLQYLSKAQLKRVRLVSKLWSGFASEFLFATVYISSHQLDLQTFKAVVQHPLLRRCVKEVVYDAIHFTPHITISEYIQILRCQTSGLVYQIRVFKNLDPQIFRFLTIFEDLESLPHQSQDMIANARMQCRDFAFIQEGYRKWMDQAAFETKCFEGTAFLTCIVFGLKQLGHIRSVRLGDGWRADAKLSGRGSPLARSWHPFHARPRCWLLLDDGGTRPLDSSRASADFWALAFALLKAGKSGIRKLLFQTVMAPTVFTKRSSEKHLDHGAAVYCEVEDLKLSFAEDPKAPMIDLGDNLHGLQRMLKCMKVLKRFELRLPGDFEIEPPDFLSYARVFPGDGHWPHITTFTLQNLAIGTQDLITLTTTKMPSLRHLEFGNINLLDAHWEGVIEYLRVSDRLSSFNLKLDSILFHRGESNYLLEPRELINGRIRYDSYLRFRRSLHEYVVNWRHEPTLRHPSLMPNQPATLSLHYLRDVYRLCGIDSTGDTLEGLAKHMAAEVARFNGNEKTERKLNVLNPCCEMCSIEC